MDTLAIEQLEWDILKRKNIKIEDGNDITIMSHWLIMGDYKSILESQASKTLLGREVEWNSHVQELQKTFNIIPFIEKRVSEYVKDSKTALQCLILGAALLEAFVQINYTGPEFSLKPQDILPRILFNNEDFGKQLNTISIVNLEIDGEQAYHLITNATFLLLAETILTQPFPQLKTIKWWRSRSGLLRQRILDDHSATLHDRLLADLKSVGNVLPNNDPDLKVRLLTEQGIIFHIFTEGKEAAEKFRQAGVESGLKWELTGRLGKRTKFQDKEISQLVVLAEGRERINVSTEMETKSYSKSDYPTTLNLNDDTLLESTKFTSSSHEHDDTISPLTHIDCNNQPSLHPLDQAILLGMCLNVKNTNPNHGLTIEQMMPYIERVILHPNNWTIHTMALFIRSRLQADKSRTVERSVLQIQALIDQMTLQENGEGANKGASIRERLEYFWQLSIPAKWEMEKELAERMINLGVVRSALEIFERLEMWEHVVECYKMMERPDRAKKVLLDQIKDDPNSPKLWCLLGDVEKNIEYWEKSWYLSKNRYSRAQRAIGGYYFAHGQYQKAVDAYKLALSINPLFETTWFIYGCAAMQISNWEVAVEAFSRSVALDPENAEAWNNLGSIYLKQDPPRKTDALYAFRKAASKKFDSWKIWSNYMAICCDLGEFSEAARALERVVDIRSTNNISEDIEILRRIIDGVTRNPLNDSEDEINRLSIRIEKLLEDKIMAKMSNIFDVWKVGAKFYLWKRQWDKALEAELRAYRVVTNNPKLDTDLKTFKLAVNQALEVVDAYRNYGPRNKSESELVCRDWSYQAKLLLRSLIGKTKSNFDGTEEMETLKDTMDALKNEIE